MNSPRSSITRQLALALATILLVLITASTLFALRSLTVGNLVTHTQHLSSEARLVTAQLETFYGSLRSSTQRLAGLFDQRFANGLQIDREQKIQVADTLTPALLLDGEPLNNNFTQVDDFRRMTEGVATVFVRQGGEFIRVTTSVTTQDGSRALGTVLGSQHPAYAALLAGEPYVGSAELFDRLYMTQYTPIKDRLGEVIAVLFVGFDYTQAHAEQLKTLAQFRIGQEGSLAVVDEDDNWLVAPKDLPATTPVAQPLKALMGIPGQGGFWQAATQELYSVVMPFAGGPWHVVASMPKHEIYAVSWQVGTQLAVGSVIALVLAVMATWLLLRRKLEPLADVVSQAKALGAGDLHVRLHVARNDEIGELAHSFNQMGEGLRQMVGRVRAAANDVHLRSQALAGMSSHAYQGIDLQSLEINSMAGAVEEFSATSLNIADNMRNTERLASDNAQQTRIGRASMDEASTVLTQVSEALNATATVINDLGQRSQEIGGIVSVITAIAEQTNLLALNAAIEAARAGEQGRGFAVVADEVRNLAGRTRAATDEISLMISSIQSQTSSAIETMEEGKQLMLEGLERNAKVVSALAQITEQSNAAGEQFAAITTATSEQSSTATLLSSNLQSIAAANDVQRDVVAQLAQTASELDQLSQGLGKEVQRFS